MSVEILMPALSPTMEEGGLAKWLVKVGDFVKSGDLLAEIETDKAIMEFESAEEGTITKLLVNEGDNSIKVNEPIAIIETDSEITSKNNYEKDDKRNYEKKVSKEIGAKETPLISPDRKIELSREPHRIKASPLAKKMAKESSIDLAKILGSGPQGRIIRIDIEDYLNKNIQSLEPELPTELTSDALKNDDVTFRQVKISKMRKIIAEKLTFSKKNIPHFYLRKRVKVDKLLKAKRKLNEHLSTKKVKISLNDMILKAVAIGLKNNPDCNVTWHEDTIMKHTKTDIAMAVAIPDGLLTPVIENVDKKSLPMLSAETKILIEKSRSRKIGITELEGGTITVSNLGMMGIDNFDAVINPPQGSILAVGATKMAPSLTKNGKYSKANFVDLTLSVDHRVIDGAVGAAFLQSITAVLEEPILLQT